MVAVFERMSKRARRAVCALAPPLLVAAASAGAMPGVGANALAGLYHVYSCRTPAGESAPADGWSGSVAGAASFTEDTCSQPGGALIAALGEAPRTANTDIATWAFEAPAGESVAGATLWRAGDADGGSVVNADYEFWFAGPNNSDPPTPEDAFGLCGSGTVCAAGA